ncbi:hypothetical protein [Pseudomonas mangiferae]|uniref:Uncharacterized protein n=1 Tax=Pseudomonas mangiferae TaxID=2593654 RepID=A0A553H3K3_9PSED|nr:hypothetical protein [Pseudomonas mangiferae]TRX76319.1 hypothetical protein FM069_03790 [Pseudomonas mangiferae]
MKLEITRGLFLVGALATASLAAATWQEPAPRIISLQEQAQACLAPPISRAVEARSEPDRHLLLLMFGLSQGYGGD